MKINFIYDPNVSYAQMIGYEIAALMWGQLFTDDMEVNIFAQGTDSLDSNIIGGAIPEFHEQHYALFLQYYEADITSEDDQLAFDALQQGNTVDFLLNGDLVGGNTKLKLTTALAKSLGMTEAISLERYVLDESEQFLDGTIMMNQSFTWDFNYLRNSEAAENTLDFLSVALHETGHILGFTSGLDFSLQQDTLYSGRTELSNFSPLDLFRFSAESLAQHNPDGAVNDLSIGGVAWFSTDGGETLSAKMSTGKEGDGFQASHWERRYDPLGIMDPTLWYQERAVISDLDVLAFDILGYDLSSIAGDVENLFDEENLEVLLAQAKVQLAYKLGMTVQELENQANVPLSSPELIAEMETVYLEAVAEGSTTENIFPIYNSSSSELDSLSDEELKDFFKDLDKMMRGVYRWWAQNNGGQSSSWQELYEWWAQNNGGQSSSWQELFEWWAQNNGGQSSSWQELFEWWAQNNGGQSSSWQELFEWWAQNNGGQSSSWQELYEWWAQNNGGQSSSWQELSQEELAEFHQEVTGNQPSWWQEVFFASQDDGNLEDLELPGENNDTTEGPIHYQEFHGSHDDDIIGGDTSNDTIVTGKGDDLIDGAAGDDTIFGAGGYDTIFGFDGKDSLMGGMGDDVISGESDEDVLFGEAGADVLMGGDHDDYLDGGAGRDFLNGNRGHDVLIGGTGDDALEGESGKDLLVGGEGQDIVNGGSGDDFIFGDQYSESLQEEFGDNLSPLISLYVPAVAPETSETNNEEINTEESDQDPLFIEAEAMTLTGDYKLKTLASGETLVRNDSETTLATTFSGTTGMYDIVISYHDLLGTGQMTANVNEVAIDSWLLNKDLGGWNSVEDNLTSYVIRGVSLNEGDYFALESIRDKSDKGYIDSVQFIPVNEIDNSSSTLVLDGMRVEAETLNWTGITKIETQSLFASGGSYVLNDAQNSTITGSTTFTGESGVYNLVLGYYDSDNGEAQVSVNLNGAALDSWSLDLDINYSDDILNGLMDYFSNGVAPLNFVTRTVATGVTLNQGDTLEIEGIRYDDDDKVALDFIEFVPYNPHARIKIEAEYFNLTGDYQVEEKDFASGGRLFKSDSNVTATTAFRGLSGYYDIVIGYYDSNDGEAELTASLAGTELDSWLFDKDLGTPNAAATNFVTRKVAQGVMVNEGDILELQGIQDFEDRVYIDYVEFIPVEAPVETPPQDTPSEDTSALPPEVELGLNSDILRGGTGNDGIDGGKGNDIIFGEDEFNNSSYIYAPLIDGAFTYGHSSYILSQAATLEEAKAEAESYGGYLVTANDAGEKQWLIDTFDFDTNNDYVIEIEWSSIGGNDTILGGAGDDQIYGNSGNDLLYGDTNKISETVPIPETLSFQQGVDGYNGTVDTMLEEDKSNANNSSKGSLSVDSDKYEQSIIRFEDLFGSQIGQIGLEHTITSAVLEIDVSDSGDSFTVHELLQNWSDNSTWNSWGNGIQANGVEAASTPVFTTGSVNTGILQIDVTASLQAWQADPTTNYGWAFLPTGSGGVDFDSAEGGNAPRLIVDVDVIEIYEEGNDTITGNGGNDTIFGGASNDIINGTDEIVAGYYEKDVLIGNTGADKFILGDEDQAYYATGGDQDYAVIQDFNVNLDTLQLYGSAMDYQQVQQGNDTHLTRNGDLVVILENNSTTLNLNGSAFEYVSTV